MSSNVTYKSRWSYIASIINWRIDLVQKIIMYCHWHTRRFVSNLVRNVHITGHFCFHPQAFLAICYNRTTTIRIQNTKVLSRYNMNHILQYILQLVKVFVQLDKPFFLHQGLTALGVIVPLLILHLIFGTLYQKTSGLAHL